MNELKGCDDEIDFQTDYLVDIAKEANYGYDLDTAEEFHVWEKHKRDNILTYRDQSYASKFTGSKSPIHHTTWIEALDDSKETFLNTKQWRKGNGLKLKKDRSDFYIWLEIGKEKCAEHYKN